MATGTLTPVRNGEARQQWMCATVVPDGIPAFGTSLYSWKQSAE